MTKIIFDLESTGMNGEITFIDGGTVMDNIIWVKRQVLHEKHARALYDLGMYDTLEIIECRGYDWKLKFKMDDAMQQMGKAITYPSSHTFRMKVKVKDSISKKETDRILQIDKKSYNRIKELATLPTAA